MAENLLTDAKCRNAKAPAKLLDGGNLYLEVRPSSKLWRWRYRLAGKENMLALGKYPDVTLQEARAKRDEARRLVAQGVNPAHQKRLDKLKRLDEMATTFEAVAAEYIERNAGEWSERYKGQVERTLARDVFPWIGKLPVADVKPAHVLDILQRIEKRSPAMAKLAKTWVGGIFRHSVATLKREDDPTWPLRRAVKPTQVKHHATLRQKEIAPFLKAMEAAAGDYTVKAAAKFMWLTVGRANEVIGARWAEIDFDEALWIIPPERMKNKQEQIVPLSTQAVELLRQMQPHSSTLEFVFPHRSERRRHMSGEGLRDLFRRAGYEGKFTPHGVRGTFSTMANEAHFEAEVIELCLAHKERNAIRAAYNAARKLPARRDLLQWWADLSDAAQKGTNVVPMRRPA